MKRLVFSIILFWGISANALANVLSTYDDFNIDVSSGWGNTRTGNPWITQGSGTFGASSGSGQVTLPSAYTRTHALTNIGFANVEGAVILHVEDTPSAGYIDAGITLRHAYSLSGSLTAYVAYIRFEENDARLIVGKVVNDAETNFVTFTLPIAPQPDEDFIIKFSAHGNNATKLAAKAWPKQSVEPSEWQIVTEDSEAILQQTNGYTGIKVSTSSSYVGSGSISYQNFFVAKCNDNCGVVSGDVNAFYADVLFSDFKNSVQGSAGSKISNLDLSTILGKYTHVRVYYDCNVLGKNNWSENYVSFKNDLNDEILRVLGCRFAGVADNQSVATEGTRIIPIPYGTTNIELFSRQTGSMSYSGNRSVLRMDVLGKQVP